MSRSEVKIYKLPVKYSEINPKERREVRLQYIKEQKNLCFYCKSNLDNPPPKNILSKSINWELFPKGFLDYPIHLQHSHKTDLTEGAVHAYCNAVLWQYLGR